MGIFDLFKKKIEPKIAEKQIVEKEPYEKIMEIDERLNKISDYGNNLSTLNTSQQVVLIIENLEREINNGGFNLFYSNSSGNHAHITVEYLKKIGADKTAELVEKANLEWPNNNVPKDRTERQAILKKIEHKADQVWEDCGQLFYKYEDDIPYLLMKFVNANRTDFE
ncbi:hypothetical protein SCB49_03229 [unidentified eubacterium SCB49]|nr:hypothetical protein SCB49_03229 [unidentified eubacterium SCB49]